MNAVPVPFDAQEVVKELKAAGFTYELAAAQNSRCSSRAATAELPGENDGGDQIGPNAA
jgi:hypothetical protein